jgi:hypothetical protein
MEALMNWKVAGMAGTAMLTVMLTGVGAVAGANKFTGNFSLAVGQSFENDDIVPWGPDAFDDSFASITGEAKVNIAFSNHINLQLGFVGVGSFADRQDSLDLDRDAGFQGDAHLYYRNDQYAIGAFGGAGIASGANFFNNNGERTADYYYVGLEAQHYWRNFTFGLNGGYLDSSTDSAEYQQPGPNPSGEDLFLNNAWFVGGEARWYATEKVTVSANLGYISGDARFGRAQVDTLHWGAKAEYWPEEKEPLSLWVAYEGRNSDFDYASNYAATDFSKDVHTVKVGITFHFGVEGTKQDNDRSGPAFNTQDYGAIVVGG